MYVAPESAERGVAVFSPLGKTAEGALKEKLKDSDELLDLAQLKNEYRDGLSVVVLANGRFRVSRSVIESGFDDVISYHFHPKGEEFFSVGGESLDVETPELFLTPYGSPTFFLLEEALDDYASNIARYGEMHGLRDLWRDERRLMFKPKPERGMRRSLESFLSATLRGTSAVELRPEQNVNETEPADIKVSFSHANRRAYIEIKWMGDSAPVKVPEGKRPVRRRDAAVRDGAKQLASYLNEDRIRSLDLIVSGYLVIYDARRRGLKAETKAINPADGGFYRDREVEIDPEILAREDFASPRRMFMEPVCRS